MGAAVLAGQADIVNLDITDGYPDDDAAGSDSVIKYRQKNSLCEDNFIVFDNKRFLSPS